MRDNVLFNYMYDRMWDLVFKHTEQTEDEKKLEKLKKGSKVISQTVLTQATELVTEFSQIAIFFINENKLNDKINKEIIFLEIMKNYIRMKIKNIDTTKEQKKILLNITNELNLNQEVC